MIRLNVLTSLHCRGDLNIVVGAFRVLVFFLFITEISFSSTVNAGVVKMSNSGLCHPPQSSWYGRTKNYEAFDSIEACLDSGGALPKGMSRASINGSQRQPDEQHGYQRSAFGHGWDDADGDCQDSRAEALIAQSTTQVRFADESRCRVVTGRWISPFTGNVIQNSSGIDIDHVVPLKWAWEHGADSWSRAKRERFANDPANLMSVEASLNRQKGARGPESWLPPTGKCQYLSRFVRIVKVYELMPAAAQRLHYRNQLAKLCG